MASSDPNPEISTWVATDASSEYSYAPPEALKATGDSGVPPISITDPSPNSAL
jgi:hypothetical protein